MLKCHQSLQEGEAKKEEIAQRNNIRFYASWMMLSNEESRGEREEWRSNLEAIKESNMKNPSSVRKTPCQLFIVFAH